MHVCCELFLFPFNIEFQVFDIVSILCFLGGLFRFAGGFILGFQADLFQGGEVIVTTPALVTG